MILRLDSTRKQTISHPTVLAPTEDKLKNDEIKQHVQKTPSIIVDNLSLLVLYGSDTGVAEGIARELADTASLEGVQTEVVALNDRIGSLPKKERYLL